MSKDAFFRFFSDGDVGKAEAWLAAHDDLNIAHGYRAPQLLREWVEEHNGGHCYKREHRQVANLLTAEVVRSFRDAVVENRLEDVGQLVKADGDLVDADITAGRGIAQAIHHWNSNAVGEVLIESGAELNALTTLGESPISMQLRFGTVDGLKLLLESGADPNIGDGGHMPSSTMDACIRLLLDFGWNIDRCELLHDANHGHGKRVEEWLKFGADPNRGDSQSRTALHLLAIRGAGRDAIRALVEAGADLDLQDDDGNRPIDLAKRAPIQSAASELRRLGATES